MWEKVWRWADVKMSRCERRCEDEQMWEKMWENMWEKMWRWADVREDVRCERRCEDEQMWEKMLDVREGVKMSRCESRCDRRCEDEQMWRWADVKMSRCEDEKVWRWEGEIQTPTIGRTLRSDALGKKWWILHDFSRVALVYRSTRSSNRPSPSARPPLGSPACGHWPFCSAWVSVSPWEDWAFTGNRRTWGPFTGFKQQNLGLELARILTSGAKKSGERCSANLAQWNGDFWYDFTNSIPRWCLSFMLHYDLQLPHVFTN